MTSTSDALMTLNEYKQSLLISIHIGIAVTNNDDAYSVGLRNGLRICKAYIDGQEPEYEEVKNDPLTWDELKSMEGKPVWVEIVAPDNWKAWFLISGIDDSFLLVFDSKGDIHNFPRVCLDTRLWQAYRKERK